MAAAGSAAASGPGLAAPLPGAGTAPHAIVDAAEACPPSEGPVAALHLARQMLQVRRDKAAPTGAAAAAAAATESGTRPTRTLQAAGVQVPMYQTSSGVRRAVGEYRGWCGSLNVSVKVSDHAGTFEQYSTGLVGVAPRLVGHAMSLPAAGVGGASGSAPHAVTALPAPRMGKGSVALVRAACVRGCTLLLTWSRVLEEEAAEDPADGDDGAPAATAQGGGGGGAADQPAPAAPQAAQIQGNGGGELAQQPGPAAVGDAAGPSASAPAALLALSSPAPPSVSSVQAQVGSTLVRWARQADRERDAAAERHSHGRGGSASAADAAGSGGAAIALSGAMRAADVERGAALAGEEARLYGAVPEMLPVQEVVRLVHVSPPALAWPVIRGSGSGGAAGMGGGAGAALQPAVVRLCVVSAGPLRTRVLVLAAAAAAAEVRAGGIVTSGTGMMAAAVLKEVPVVLHSGVQDIELDLADVVQGLVDDATAPAAGPGGGGHLGACSLQLVLTAPQHPEQQWAAAAADASVAAAGEGEVIAEGAVRRGEELLVGAADTSRPAQPRGPALQQPAHRGPGSAHAGLAALAGVTASGGGIVHAGSLGRWDAAAVDGHAGEWAVLASEDDGSDMALPFVDSVVNGSSLHAHGLALMQQLPSGALPPLPAAAREEQAPPLPGASGAGAGSALQPRQLAPAMAELMAAGARVGVRGGGAASPAAASSADSSQAAAMSLTSHHLEPGAGAAAVASAGAAAAAAAAAAAQPLVHFFAPLLVLPADAAAEVNGLWASFSGAAAAPLGELQNAVQAAAADIAEMLVDVNAEAFARRLAASNGSDGGGIMGTRGSSFSLGSSSDRSEDDGGWRPDARRRLAPPLDVVPGAAAAAVAAGAAAEADLGGAELHAAALGEAWTVDMEPLIEDIAALLELNAMPVPAQEAGRAVTRAVAAAAAAAAAAGGGRGAGGGAAVDVVGVTQGLPSGAAGDAAHVGCNDASSTCGICPASACDEDSGSRTRTLSSGCLSSRAASPPRTSVQTSAAPAAVPAAAGPAGKRPSGADSGARAGAAGASASSSASAAPAPASFSAAERRLAKGLAASLLPHLRETGMPATSRVVTAAAVHVLGQQAVDAMLVAAAPSVVAAPADSGLLAGAATAAAPAAGAAAQEPVGLRQLQMQGDAARNKEASGAKLESHVAGKEAACTGCYDTPATGTAAPGGKQPHQQQQLLLPLLAEDFRAWRVAELLRGAGGRARMCLVMGLASSVQSLPAIARGEESAMKLVLLALFILAEVLGNLCIAVGAKIMINPRPAAERRIAPTRAGPAPPSAAATGSSEAQGCSVGSSGGGSTAAAGAGGLGAVGDRVQMQRATLQILASVYDWATLVGIPLLLFLCSLIMHFGWIRPFDHFTGPSRLLAIILYRGMWQAYSHPILLRHALCISVVMSFLDIVIYRYTCPVAWPVGVLMASAVTRILFCGTCALLEWRARRRFYAARAQSALRRPKVAPQ
ncbi:hypothetical protein CHLRE_16g674100v5 [Chlamydomonas reinhardtii]|nr:uncharacterized protein CHLRE_16g674100v5 [Chlamydomonas reinhardtii]PNW72296.1 hypothetical protein CHLRE_16g674100v5 [Chlamydomonas reinhardtii]